MITIGSYIYINYPVDAGAISSFAKIVGYNTLNYIVTTDGIDRLSISKNSYQLSSIPIDEIILTKAGFNNIDVNTICVQGKKYSKLWCMSSFSGHLPVFVGFDGTYFFYIYQTPQNVYSDLQIDVIDELQYHVYRNKGIMLVMSLLNTTINKQKMLDYINSQLNPKYYVMVGSTTGGVRYQSGNPSNIDFNVMMSCDIYTDNKRLVVTITNFQQKTATICIEVGQHVIKYNHGADLALLQQYYNNEFQLMSNAEFVEFNSMYEVIRNAIDNSLVC